MPALPYARLPRIRRILVGSSLLVALVSAVPSAPTYARVISDEAFADSALTSTSRAMPAASMPVAPPVKQPAVASATAAPDQVKATLNVSVGPAMRPLLKFNPIWPAHGVITTYFGERGALSPRGHSGVDVAGPQGTPILAMDDGEVLKAYWSADGYGGLVVIGHVSGYETWYAHLARFSVEKGQQVKRGEQIGGMGSTGFSTGTHLHFEVRHDGQLCDPLDFLSEARL